MSKLLNFINCKIDNLAWWFVAKRVNSFYNRNFDGLKPRNNNARYDIRMDSVRVCFSSPIATSTHDFGMRLKEIGELLSNTRCKNNSFNKGFL